ncbi:MFS transporter [Pseudarthrobacter sp. NPDC058119]|uniref:MFS transporter n=1 Tax=Pseudarthrobacter sp. NPDC058119 TaxID=3346348 RepID=UPI0036DE0EBF
MSIPAYLIPYLHTERGLSLTEAGMLAATPTLGMVITLVAWGAAADRYGERWVIAGGLAGTAIFTLLAVSATDTAAMGVMLGLAGGAAASSNAATGSVVVGWFPRSRRGLAMGIRQMSQPLGVAAAALTVPTMAAHYDVAGPLIISGITALVLAVACAVGIRNPPRVRQDVTFVKCNPYRESTFLWRIHAVSMLLVAPQFTLSIFGLVWLTSVLRWEATPAGIVIALAQFIGALGRIAVGHLSDRAGSRVRVLRWVAVSGVMVMLLLALTGWQDWSLPGALVLILATVVSVADNGIAFTSAAEAAGPRWSGRALGTQNTGQFLVASAVGPVAGTLIGFVGYPAAFAFAALAPLISLPLIPATDPLTARGNMARPLVYDEGDDDSGQSPARAQ